MFIKFWSGFFKNNATASKLKLTDYYEVRAVSDDMWNKVPNSDIRLNYYDQNNKHIASISFRLQNGQIGHLFIHDDNLIGRGLGKQLLMRAINEIKNQNYINPHVKEIWAVTSNDNFFSNVFNKSFAKRVPAHSSVRGSGYYMQIDKTIE